MNATTMAVVSVLALMGLAGCTGSFDIDQTEPFRVQLDGAPQTVVVREGAAPREVNVQTCPDDVDPCDVDEVEVRIDATRTSTEACSIKVIIKTASGEILGERVIDLGSPADDGGDDGNMTGNETGNATATGGVTETGGDTTVQNIFVNVKGNKNIIVVTQAIQGEANVNVQAIKASGNADVDADQDAGSTTTMTTTASTNSTTNTTTY